MVHALLLVGAVPLGLLDTSLFDPDLGVPGGTHTHAHTHAHVHTASLDMNWRALLDRLGTPQLPDIILSSSQHPTNNAKHKPDILLANPPSATAAEANTPSEVKAEVPSSSSSSSSSSPSQEAMKSQSTEGRLPLADWLREALSVLRYTQDEDKEEEEEQGMDERDGTAGSAEWREAGVLLRKIGDLLDGCSAWSDKGRTTSAPLRFSLARPLACCCYCCCCLAASVLGLLTWRLLLWCR